MSFVRPLCAMVGATLVGLGCGQSLAPQSLVDKLRILGVRATPPEAPPSTVVHVDALWADPNGMGRPVFFAWLSCAGAAEDARQCLGGGGTVTPLAAGNGVDQVDVTIPPTALDALPAGQTSTVSLVLLAMCAGGAPTFSPTSIQCPEGDPVLAFKRITVSRSSTPNQNPLIASPVLLGGAGWDPVAPPMIAACPAAGCGPVSIEVDATAASAESCDPTTTGCPTTGTEQLLLSWFATAGSFAQVRSDAAPFVVGWTPPPAPGLVQFWFVLRDGRGGTDWQTRTLSLQ